MSFRNGLLNQGRSTVFVLVALIVGVSSGIGVSVVMGGASATSSGAKSVVSSIGVAAASGGSSNATYPTNANGQTYGSAVGASLSNPPDLILTYASNGQIGYVYSSQLSASSGANVTTPSEAVAWDAIRNRIQVIPVYAVDGTTVIGNFSITPGVAISPSTGSPIN